MNFKDFFAFKLSFPRAARAGSDPERDWRVMLAFFAAGLALFAMGAAFLYWEGEAAPQSVTPAPAGRTVSSVALDALLAKYQALDMEHASLLSGAPIGTASPGVADPRVSQ